MNGVDAIVFTAGIGENDRKLRADICRDMDAVGIVMDEAANDACPRGTTGDLTAATSRAKVFAIPTDEEYMIALDTQKIANA
jgi:acetate kinase